MVALRADEERPIRKDIHNSDLPVVCQACEARHKGVCGALTPEQLTRLSKTTRKTNYASNTELQSFGQNQERYANILSGVVKLTKSMSDGRQQIVGLQFAPDFMGRPFKQPSHVSANAATKVSLCSFPKAVLEEMLMEAPEMEHRVHEQKLAELDEARDWLLALGRKSATEKVASFLLLISTHIDPESDIDATKVEFELPLKRAEIADFLGLTIETVSRQITRLSKAGIVEAIGRNRVKIPDLSALRQAACEECY